MSVEAIAWALRRQDVRGTDKLVLIGLANHADPHGRNAWPAVSTLAVYASVDKRNVQRALTRLEDAGLVAVERNAGGNHDTPSDRRTNRYTLSMDGVAPVPPRGVTPPRERGGASAIPRGGAGATRTVPKTIKEPRSTDNGFTFLPGTGWISRNPGEEE